MHKIISSQPHKKITNIRNASPVTNSVSINNNIEGRSEMSVTYIDSSYTELNLNERLIKDEEVSQFAKEEVSQFANFFINTILIEEPKSGNNLVMYNSSPETVSATDENHINRESNEGGLDNISSSTSYRINDHRIKSESGVKENNL